MLKPFFTKLWTDYPQVKQMENDFGSVKSHYEKLISSVGFIVSVCPFCGIESFEPPTGKYREAYDHFIAKANYPFVSINFDLLFPACHKCNSNEKRDIDTLYRKDSSRRLVYYPYNPITSNSLSILIQPKEDYSKTTLQTLLKTLPTNIELRRNGNEEEELTSWDEVFNIKRRYLEKITHLESEWFKHLLKIYKRSKSKGESFQTFKEEILVDCEDQIYVSPQTILKYSYYKFLFDSEKFQERLDYISEN
ncbi:hypothetical protein V5739_14645 [Salinimicrobium sp. TIG7-5_MAKvit]|uniref:hypothetical protein n=1 Tax=Salinimicrobium sp. TIG7-5_MAKvit TaxID=3121289 RepID=UPI003C6E5A4A